VDVLYSSENSTVVTCLRVVEADVARLM
jgi:hypothetical protein